MFHCLKQLKAGDVIHFEYIDRNATRGLHKFSFIRWNVCNPNLVYVKSEYVNGGALVIDLRDVAPIKIVKTK